MATERQIAANRANAQKSTGPRTARGKAAVRLNSVTHGLTAQSILTYGEEGELAELQAVRAALEAEWQPQTITETLLLDEASACWWRLRRGRAAEDFCCAAAVKYLDGNIDEYTLINDNRRRGHVPTKIEILGVAFRDRHTAQQMTRISLYAGRNFRQLYRCFQQIIQLRKSGPIETAVEPIDEPIPQPQPEEQPEPPLKTVADLQAALSYVEFRQPRQPQSPAPAPEPELEPEFTEVDYDTGLDYETGLEPEPGAGPEPPIPSPEKIGVDLRSSAAEKTADPPAQPMPPGVAATSEPEISNRCPENDWDSQADPLPA